MTSSVPSSSLSSSSLKILLSFVLKLIDWLMACKSNWRDGFKFPLCALYLLWVSYDNYRELLDGSMNYMNNIKYSVQTWKTHSAISIVHVTSLQTYISLNCVLTSNSWSTLQFTMRSSSSSQNLNENVNSVYMCMHLIDAFSWPWTHNWNDFVCTT